MKYLSTNIHLKYRFEIFLLVTTTLLASACATIASPDQTTTKEVVEEFIKLGPDATFHDTTTLTESSSQYFCLGQKIEVTISTRQNISDEETYISHTITARLNGKPFNQANNALIQIENSDNYAFIIPSFNCLDNKIILYLMGYNDGTAHSGKLIETIEANLNL